MDATPLGLGSFRGGWLNAAEPAALRQRSSALPLNLCKVEKARPNVVMRPSLVRGGAGSCPVSLRKSFSPIFCAISTRPLARHAVVAAPIREIRVPPPVPPFDISKSGVILAPLEVYMVNSPSRPNLRPVDPPPLGASVRHAIPWPPENQNPGAETRFSLPSRQIKAKTLAIVPHQGSSRLIVPDQGKRPNSPFAHFAYFAVPPPQPPRNPNLGAETRFSLPSR